MKSVGSMLVLIGAMGFTGCAVSPEEPSEANASVGQAQKKWGGTTGECSVEHCHADGDPGIKEPGTFACWFGVCVCIGASSGKTGQCDGGSDCKEAGCSETKTSEHSAWQKSHILRDSAIK